MKTKTGVDRSARAPSRIGLAKERSLHAAIKEWYAEPGDEFEVGVDGYVIDLVRPAGPDGRKLLIEIQTRNFTAIAPKLQALVARYQVRLVYPIPRRKTIIRITADGEVCGSRRSPKSGTALDLFRELVRIPKLINEPNFSIEVLLIEEEEIRRADGRGSWRRKGVSIADRRLMAVEERLLFRESDDFRCFLPPEMPLPFSNKEYACFCKCSIYLARKLTYCLKKMGLLYQVGKRGNQLLYAVRDFEGKVSSQAAGYTAPNVESLAVADREE